MPTCVHHIPGRLRLKVPGLARAADGGAALRAHLAALHGVREVAVNPRADSVTVVYDVSSLDPSAILGRMAMRAIAPLPAPPRRASRAAAAGPGSTVISASAARLGGLFGKALVDAMLARGVERSVRLLVGGR